MNVEKVMTTQVCTCTPTDSLERAAQLMWDEDCGVLPVCTGDNESLVVGMITDRDICMSARFEGKPLRDLPVSRAMSRQLVSCRANDSIAHAEKTMREARVRRLPVVNDRGALVGIIGIVDLARAAARERGGPVHEVSSSEVGDTLAAICGTCVGRTGIGL